MAWIQSPVVYAALGDSMSIDDYAGGPGRGPASLLWRNRDRDFPAWAGRDLTTTDPTARLVLLASDGSTSTTVAGDQLGRLRRMGLTPSLATVTMGGNDLLAAYGDTTAARRAIRTVVDNGRLVLVGLRALMGPEAPIMVATVYDPSDGSGDAGRLGLPPWPAALELLAELNRALRALAEDHQALVADIHARYLGHGLATGNPAQSAARPLDRDLWYCGLIEPNAWGPARSGPPSGRHWSRRLLSNHDHMESSSTTPPEQQLADGPAYRPAPWTTPVEGLGLGCAARARSGRSAAGRPGARGHAAA